MLHALCSFFLPFVRVFSEIVYLPSSVFLRGDFQARIETEREIVLYRMLTMDLSITVELGGGENILLSMMDFVWIARARGLPSSRKLCYSHRPRRKNISINLSRHKIKLKKKKFTV